MTEETRERRIALVVNQFQVFLYLLRLPEYSDNLASCEHLVSGADNPWIFRWPSRVSKTLLK